MRRVLASCLIVCAAFAAATTFQWLGQQGSLWLSDFTQLVAAAVAAVACWWHSRALDGRSQLGWRLLAAGCAAWGVGQIFFTISDLQGLQDADFSLEDFGFLGMVPLAATGVLLIPRGLFLARTRRRRGLEAFLVSVSLLALSWALVLGPIARDTTLPISVQFLLASYPAADLIIAAAAFCALPYATREERSSHIWIVAGLTAIAVADSAYTVMRFTGGYATGGVLDVAWVAGFLAIALGAWRSSEPTSDLRVPTLEFSTRFAYGLVAVCAAGMLWGTIQGQGDLFLVVLAGLVLATVGLRAWSDIRERSRTRFVVKIREATP